MRSHEILPIVIQANVNSRGLFEFETSYCSLAGAPDLRAVGTFSDALTTAITGEKRMKITIIIVRIDLANWVRIDLANWVLALFA